MKPCVQDPVNPSHNPANMKRTVKMIFEAAYPSVMKRSVMKIPIKCMLGGNQNLRMRSELIEEPSETARTGRETQSEISRGDMPRPQTRDDGKRTKASWSATLA